MVGSSHLLINRYTTVPRPIPCLCYLMLFAAAIGLLTQAATWVHAYTAIGLACIGILGACRELMRD